jgi:acetyl esterase/lipase
VPFVRTFVAAVALVAVLVLALLSNLPPSEADAPQPQHRDLAYASASPAQRLDLYLPASAESAQTYPLVIFVHGGAWQSGDKGVIVQAENGRLLRALLDGGYAVASVGYRLADEAQFPAQAHDLKAAVRWLREHAGKYGLDRERFAALGQSAGGHLVQLLGTTGGVARLEGGLGNAHESSLVQAVVSEYGVSDLTTVQQSVRDLGCPDFPGRGGDRLVADEALLGGRLSEPGILEASVEASPITYASMDDPPFLLIHGRADCIVASEQSVKMHRALTNAGARSELRLIEGEHGGPPFSSDESLSAIVDFLRRALPESREQPTVSPCRHTPSCQGKRNVPPITSTLTALGIRP